MRLALSLVLVVAACDSLGGGGGGGGSGAKVVESGTKRGSAGGFSAQLSAELAKQNIEPASIGTPPPTPKTTTPADTKATSATGAGADTKSTSATGAGPDTKAASAAGAASSDSKAAPDTSVAVTDTKNTGPADPKATSASDVKQAATPAGQAAQTPGTGGTVTPSKGIENRVTMKPTAEQAQIKFDLEPNWERDVGEAGTFSLVVKTPAGEQKVFYARYGFEDQSAPADCDAYRTFLETKKILTVSLNRQRGAACYIEGTDASGLAMYRYLETFGGKRLMCTGSLYKDQAALGDLRDKVLQQAKKICETLAL